MKVNREYKIREYTNTLTDMMCDGAIDPIQLAYNLMDWMSKDDVKDFAIYNGYLEEEDE